MKSLITVIRTVGALAIANTHDLVRSNGTLANSLQIRPLKRIVICRFSIFTECVNCPGLNIKVKIQVKMKSD